MTIARYNVTSLAGADAAQPQVEADGIRVRRVDPDILAEVFGAPWREVGVVAIDVGGEVGPRTLDASEVLLYVIAGAGQAVLSSGPVELEVGTSLTLLRGEQLHLKADHVPLKAFIVEMTERGAS